MKNPLAQKLHDGLRAKDTIEELIDEAFEKYEPNIYKTLEFHIDSDEYDNSIEIYIENSIPYPYEPCEEIREEIYKMGFSIVFWNFTKDVGNVIVKEGSVVSSYDEIRGWEPRHIKDSKVWVPCKYGYVDHRWDQKEWEKNYKR